MSEGKTCCCTSCSMGRAEGAHQDMRHLDEDGSVAEVDASTRLGRWAGRERCRRCLVHIAQVPPGGFELLICLPLSSSYL